METFSNKEIWICKITLQRKDGTEYPLKKDYIVVRSNIATLNACEYLYSGIYKELHYKTLANQIQINTHGNFFIKRIKWIKKIGNTNN